MRATTLLDTAWYLLVAVMVTQPKWLGALQKHAVWIDRAFGIILLVLAMRLVATTFSRSYGRRQADVPSVPGAPPAAAENMIQRTGLRPAPARRHIQAVDQ